MSPKPLTETEQEVLEWLARGATYARAGRMAGVSENSVHGIQLRIVVKLDAENLVNAVHRAHLLGLLENPGRSRGQRARQQRRKNETKGAGNVRTPD